MLVIDERAGGTAWNRLNLTAQGAGPEANQAGEVYYLKALADLKAALDYAAKRPTRPIIVGGAAIPQHGLSGSPSLRRDDYPRGAAEYRMAVNAFLASIKKPAV